MLVSGRGRAWLAAKTELLGQRGVSRRVLALEEGEQATSLTNELQQPAARVVVLLERLEVASESVDAL